MSENVCVLLSCYSVLRKMYCFRLRELVEEEVAAAAVAAASFRSELASLYVRYWIAFYAEVPNRYCPAMCICLILQDCVFGFHYCWLWCGFSIFSIIWGQGHANLVLLVSTIILGKEEGPSPLSRLIISDTRCDRSTFHYICAYTFNYFSLFRHIWWYFSSWHSLKIL